MIENRPSLKTFCRLFWLYTCGSYFFRPGLCDEQDVHPDGETAQPRTRRGRCRQHKNRSTTGVSLHQPVSFHEAAARSPPLQENRQKIQKGSKGGKRKIQGRTMA